MFTRLWESLAKLHILIGRSTALSLLLFFGTPIFFPSTARAEVIITEILAQPESGTEWIELATTGEETVTISNYTLYDTVSSPSLLVTFPEDTQLQPNQALVVEIPGTKLNNSGDSLSLYDAQNMLVTTASYTESNKGLSWQRTLDTTTYQELPPTPGEISIPTPTPSPSSSPDVSSSPDTKPIEKSPTPTPSVKLNDVKTDPTEEKPKVTQEEIKEKILTAFQHRPYKPFVNTVSTVPETTLNASYSATATATTVLKKSFIPPKSAALSFMGSGILISSASYLWLYVSENIFTT